MFGHWAEVSARELAGEFTFARREANELLAKRFEEHCAGFGLGRFFGSRKLGDEACRQNRRGNKTEHEAPALEGEPDR
jgi:hypothetical protein